ncbi:MAG: NAD-dependent epimerase/dehydratase family protein [Gemmatimonadota bacterium]
MTPTRRDFIRTTGVLGAGLTLIGPTACTGGAGDAGSSTPAPKRILIFGGTGFIGPHTVQYAIERGHQVTTFTRGRSDADLPEGVERLVGDRNDDHTALEGRSWDVVIDNNAQDYRWVEKSTELLKGAAQQYVFVSSISAYQLEGFDWSRSADVLYQPIVGVDYPLIEAPEGWTHGEPAAYGHMKALSEHIVRAAFPGRATIVRPGLIVGPGDETNRFGYWPLRLDDGGEVLAPGNPEHAYQVIDQRDLTEWIVRLAEDGTAGDFNGTGPGERLSFGSALDQIGEAATKPYSLTWIPESFLEAQGLMPWRDFPSWIPGDPLMFVDVSASVAAGLTFRPLSLTARDTLAFERSRDPERVASRPFGLTREREQEVLAAWHATQG